MSIMGFKLSIVTNFQIKNKIFVLWFALLLPNKTFRLRFFSFHSLFKSPVPFARAQTISLPLDLSSLFYSFARLRTAYFFSSSCAHKMHKCSNSWRCHSKRERKKNVYVWLTKISGRKSHLQLRNKGQTETRSAYNNKLMRLD